MQQLPNLKKLKIISYPDPRLRLVAEPIEKITPEIKELAEIMLDLMIKSQGVGLAAPQVGVSLRLIIVSTTGLRNDAIVLINPLLSNLDGASVHEEGCLSVPGVNAKVRRYATCTVTALDLDGNEVTIEADELAAIAFQHETDHLNGTLFIDKLSTVGKIAARKGIKRLEEKFDK
ncbi:MAG: peptide deformylase [Phycisphaerae bacterium]|nr:peptide deformylase [Phycisphaerae bacterium]